MSELEEEYQGRVTFEIIQQSEPRFQKEVDQFEFGAQRHGLVGLTVDGEVGAKIPGHQFGREEIEAAIQKILTGS